MDPFQQADTSQPRIGPHDHPTTATGRGRGGGCPETGHQPPSHGRKGGRHVRLGGKNPDDRITKRSGKRNHQKRPPRKKGRQPDKTRHRKRRRPPHGDHPTNTHSHKAGEETTKHPKSPTKTTELDTRGPGNPRDQKKPTRPQEGRKIPE